MTNHFYAIDPQGKVHTRSSKGRTYTHTVVVLKGEAAAARDLATGLLNVPPSARESYEFSVDKAAGRVDRTWNFKVDDAARAKYTAEGQAFLTQFPTLLGYVESRLAARRTQHAQAVAEGEYNTFLNAGWAGRPDLAQKLAAQQRGEQVVILEAQVGKPPKKEA